MKILIQVATQTFEINICHIKIHVSSQLEFIE